MDCEKCGAAVPGGADTCPECGEPLGAPAAAPTPATDATPPAPEADATAPAPARPSGGRRTRVLVGVLVTVLVLAALGGVGWFVYQRWNQANSPEAAVTAMLEAYAVYDAQGILDVVTHKNLPPDGVKEFEKQAAEAKKRGNGKPAVKDWKITKTTMEGQDRAIVEIQAQWLTDPAKGTYTKRDQKLTVVKQDGKWLVKIFP